MVCDFVSFFIFYPGFGESCGGSFNSPHVEGVEFFVVVFDEVPVVRGLKDGHVRGVGDDVRFELDVEEPGAVVLEVGGAQVFRDDGEFLKGDGGSEDDVEGTVFTGVEFRVFLDLGHSAQVA